MHRLALVLLAIAITLAVSGTSCGVAA
jgi:hypothetical protein